MMKNGPRLSVAVRLPNGRIKLKKEKYDSVVNRYKSLKWPFLRGIIYLFEMLIIGMKTLTWSADQQMGEGEQPLKTSELVLTFVLAFALTILIFIALPFFLSSYIDPSRGFLFNALDGFFRFAFFVGYVSVIGMMEDVKRLFQYHGAEHKAVNCYEAKLPLTVKNAKKFTTIHPRCGTSFIVIVILLSIVLFTFITTPVWYYKFFARILLIPVIAGISYELLKLSAKFTKHPIVAMLIYPGLAMQKITTKEPDDKQLAVALRAIKAVL